MNETKFTPGPWILEFRNGSDTANIISSCEKRWDIAATFGGINDSFTDEGSAESKANAKLIAAAPDMFTALTKWCADYEAYRRNEFPDQNAIKAIYKEAKAAIAKATS